MLDILELLLLSFGQETWDALLANAAGWVAVGERRCKIHRLLRETNQEGIHEMKGKTTDGG